MGPSCQHKQYGKGIAQQLCKYAVGAGRRCVGLCAGGGAKRERDGGRVQSGRKPERKTEADSSLAHPVLEKVLLQSSKTG